MDSSGNADLFDGGANSRANVGLQLNGSADLGNGFGAGGQVSFLGTVGLEKNMVGASMQTARTGELNAGSVTKIYLTKKLGNTLVKMGRQELPKSLSPLAFTEGWNVFKNTFDAVVVINNDIQDTTLVGAYVSTGNGSIVGAPGLVDLGAYNDIAPGGAYMATVNTKLIPSVNLTGSYYHLSQLADGVDALWVDAKVSGLPVSLAVQAGTIMPGAAGMEDTVAFGAKVGAALGPVKASLAYTSVDDGSVSIQNAGTGVKTPLYTQMILNQGFISLDSSTIQAKGVMGLGDGKLIAQYAMSDRDAGDYGELDVIYKFKALDMNMLAAYVMQDVDANDDVNNVLRFWARYAF